MKNLKNLKLLLFAVVLMPTIFLSCKKNPIFISDNPEVPTIESLSTGVIPDDSAAIEKTKLTITQEYLDAKIDSLLGIPSTERTTFKGAKERIPPTVSITSPANNDSVSGTITITANASDNVGVVSVACYIDNNILATDIAAPWAFTLNTLNRAGGVHVIKVIAKDAANNSATASIQVIVYNASSGGGTGGGGSTTDITPPSVTITSPINGTSFDLGSNVAISISATDNVGVSTVELQIDGSTYMMFTSAPYTYNWSATNTIGGTHTITATAKDAAGNSTSTTNLFVVNATIAPPVSGVPSAFVLNTPTPRSQGSEGSCMAWAVGYEAFSTHWFYKTNATSYSDAVNVFSPEYMYDMYRILYAIPSGQDPANCNLGSSLQGCVQIIQDSGICVWNQMPYQSGICNTMPNSTQFADARQHKSIGTTRIYRTDSVGIKTALYNHHPIMIGIEIDNNFYNAYNGYIWRTFGTSIAGHGVSVVGYDDSKHAYKLMNSWGTGWGTGGFIWVDYDLFYLHTSYYVYYFN
ncbi:MAG: hypothetical protein RLZZ196_423 [Bacteroidota bacterium]|jgi:C1A family cysteine protease